MSKREPKLKLIEYTKKEHTCRACGKAIKIGSRAVVNTKREYFHLRVMGKCQG